ncbi:MAG: XrtA-associated tyrosine autokinase [Gammaproteobacteria bacterium]|uniref:XrtA-associated tyrosine autokinase n=1 Tax=Rhodoferax sp. TaxID=50421 RepID=UPI0018385DFC|nr:XrtA-associated tyrosine autokinase [Rhodoferax sp.]MBU3897477.1 XrtA-associated tyrosine autokinase [Gammaproteobacteria bacterium]MBA3058908.1 tyrosine-protein kinase family protein [Rhodoferax sp.]MBU3996211.1 XrtA-associated tyrosine autokinase [Gammaproteobacteria bacterium]MBU4018823.1 XrtA-associated tyrosine autokinase [Gammaproteobacteria bacterium]MBU4079778.1 XrtA-associated tyrosine autokinase [Gammaproteobacteria bacterium]
MSSLIEQAAARLEQLRQAGAEMPAATPAAHAADANWKLVADTPRAPEAALAPGSQFGVTSQRVEINLEALAKAGIVSPHAPRSQIADQFRVVKRPLISNAMGKGAGAIAIGNLIMVTSALPGEGKTFTAINLAMSMATELDYTVMLVDADVSRPAVMSTLGLPDGPGLLDLVLDESKDMSSVLLRTNIDKLTLLPSGTPHARATELLASDSMTRLLTDMATRYPDRIIIFDSPPLLLATEARVLASNMGQVVVVVQAEKTLQSDVVQALATIEACPVKLMLLNQATSASRAGYGYGYGYGHEQARTSLSPLSMQS